jgi:hypothetical protein
MDKLVRFAEILKIVPLVIGAISQVERLFHRDPAKSPAEQNKDRQDAAVEMVEDLAPLVTTLVPRVVFNVPEVQAALRTAIDAIVALHNAIRKALAAVTVTPTGEGTP